MNRELEREKTFVCPACVLKIDRDVNGARNILIKRLNEIDDK